MDLLMFIIMFGVGAIINMRIENNRIRNIRRKARMMQRESITSMAIGNGMNNSRLGSYSNYSLGYRYYM